MGHTPRYARYSITQVSKAQLQTCIMNFYGLDIRLLKTQRNNHLQVFHFLCFSVALALSFYPDVS